MNTTGRAIQYSLRVYREMRKKILEDTKNKNTDLYLGLHNKESIRKIYVDRYKVMWMVAHLECFQEIMEKNVPNEQKMYRKVFAKSYAQFLEKDGKVYYDMGSTADILKNYQSILEQMIDTSISWEQGYEDMRLQKIKFDEKYQRLVEAGIV